MRLIDEEGRPYRWWDWPAMPLATLVATTLITLALATLQLFVANLSYDRGYHPAWRVDQYVLPLCASVIAGVVYGLTAHGAAPARKKAAGWIMVGLLAAATIVVMATGSGDLRLFPRSLFRLDVSMIIATLAASIAVWVAS